MTENSPNFSELIGSRICHDMNNYLGAISNGLELLTATSSAAPELDLIQSATSSAIAHMALLRMAFGHDNQAGMISGKKVTKIIIDAYKQKSHEMALSISELTRADARLAMLSMICSTSSLPWGGRLVLSADLTGVRLKAMGRRLTDKEQLWDMIRSRNLRSDLPPSDVHFGILAQMLKSQNRFAQLHHAPEELSITILGA